MSEVIENENVKPEVDEQNVQINEQNNNSDEQDNSSDEQDKSSGEQNVQVDEQDNGIYGAPEVYDFKDLKMPEGFILDKDLAAKFEPLGKELNLSQQSANKLANLLVEYQQKEVESANEKIAEYKKQESALIKANYEKMLNEDEEIGGGNQTKMNAYIDVADVGYKEFASAELKAVLQELHLDYHPAVIKHFHRLAQLTGNDKITKTGSPAGVKQDIADIIYGSKSE